jgi:FixJ family two-component response regulator
MTGLEAGRLARQRRPGLAVLIVTGFADKLSIDAKEDIALLRKPFRQIELSQALQRAIDGGAPGAKIVPFRSRT